MRTGYKKQANYKDSFEDLYLRHDYLKKIKEHDEQAMDKYENIAKATAKIMYERHRMTYNKVSFYYDDLLNITRVYLTAFLGTESFKVQPVKLEKFKDAFFKSKDREPTKEEIQRKERNNLINFLRQRLQTCSVSCERKSRNIVASKGSKFYFACTAKTIPASHDLILEEPEVFGYRKVSDVELASIRKKYKKKKDYKDEFGFKVIMIESYSQLPISIYYYKDENMEGMRDELTEVHHERIESSAEDKFMEYEEEISIEMLKEKFSNFSKSHQKQVLTNFVNQNKGRENLSSELTVARKILNELSNVV